MEPMFVYFVEDEYLFGNVDDLATAMQNSFYAGFSVEDYVIIFDEKHYPVRLDVQKISTGWNANDYTSVTIGVIFPAFLNMNGDEDFEITSTYTLDGRA